MKNLIALLCALALTSTAGAMAANPATLNAASARAALAEGDLPGTTEEHQDAWNNATTEERDAIVNAFRDNVVTPLANEAVQTPDPTPAPDPDVQLPLPNLAQTAAASQRDLLSAFDVNELVSIAANPVLGFAAPGDDRDTDGLPESFENQVIAEFMPEYHVSAGERDDVGLTRFQDTATLTAINPPPPVRKRPPLVHARVAGLGGKQENGVLYGYLRVDYLTLWNKDSGYDPTLLCTAASGPFLGLARRAHENDVERSAALVAAPVVWNNGRATYNPDPNAYRAFYQFTTSHEDFPGTRESRTYRVVPPSAPGDHASLRVYLSKSKHGTYAFNPDGHEVVIPEVRLLVFGATIFLDLREIILGTLGGRPPNRYELIGFALAFMFDIFITDCLQESFTEQGADNPDDFVNIGEPYQPLPGYAFAGAGEVRDKLIGRPLRAPRGATQCGFGWTATKVFAPDEHYTGCRGTLWMQLDGNLVLYDSYDRPYWSSGTVNYPGAYAVFQDDGNLVVYAAWGQPLWASNTSGRAVGGRLAFQDDGNLVIDNAAGKAVWDRNGPIYPPPPPPPPRDPCLSKCL